MPGPFPDVLPPSLRKNRVKRRRRGRLYTGYPTSQAREKRPGDEVGYGSVVVRERDTDTKGSGSYGVRSPPKLIV